MLIEESRRRQSELKKHLSEMALKCMDDTEIRKMAITFKSLYSDHFRHNSTIFVVLLLFSIKNRRVGL